MNEEEYIETDVKKVEPDNIEIELEVSAVVDNENTEGKVNNEPRTVKGKKSSSQTLKDALKQVETIGQALGEALQGRGNVVMVRVNDEALEHLDMLVEAEITRSRSESAAFLINEGIEANITLFEKISKITKKIIALREQLRKDVQLDIEE